MVSIGIIRRCIAWRRLAATRERPGRGPVPATGHTNRPGPARDYSIAAVGRALDLLEALSRIGPAPLAALADQARCTRTAGFRLLRTLEARGFAIQDEARGMWRLGARWGVLGRAAVEQGALEATAMPFLAALGKTCGENVYLRVRDGLESETIAIYQADPGLRLYSEVGKRQPLHAGSSRLLLAHAPEAVQTQVLAQRLPRFTPATRTDAAWIAADLQRIRTRGYLLTTDEVVAGAATVATPVRDALGPGGGGALGQRTHHAHAPAAAPGAAADSIGYCRKVVPCAGSQRWRHWDQSGFRTQGSGRIRWIQPRDTRCRAGPGGFRTAFDFPLIVRPLPCAACSALVWPAMATKQEWRHRVY